MSQVKTLIAAMRSGWVTSATAFSDLGVTSLHRRLADLRSTYIHSYSFHGTPDYMIDGKRYRLLDEWKEITTRWGPTKVKRYRLARVK